MTAFRKVLLLQASVLIVLPIVAGIFTWTGGFAGDFLFGLLVMLWCWELFAAGHYRFCRQQEFLYILQTAGATQAPVESLLRAYLADRPREILYRGILLFFVFPGYYWIHQRRSFDFRLGRLADLLESGLPLNEALTRVPGVVSRETAVAVSIGQFSGELSESLTHLPDRRSTPQWLELAARLAYPLWLLFMLASIMTFLMVFIIPKFERIFQHFKIKLPFETEMLINISRSILQYPFYLAFFCVLLIVLINVVTFSSRIKWHLPLVGWLYRMQVRGQFLHMLGQMLATNKPLPLILDSVLESGLMPTAIADRADRLVMDVYDGHPVLESLAKNGLVTRSMGPLIASADKVQNLPWALQELGETLIRRSDRLVYRLAMVLFPVAILAVAILIGIVAICMFTPLVTLIDGVS